MNGYRKLTIKLMGTRQQGQALAMQFDGSSIELEVPMEWARERGLDLLRMGDIVWVGGKYGNDDYQLWGFGAIKDLQPDGSISKEVLQFFEVIKYHLSENGLWNVVDRYPGLTARVKELIARGPSSGICATRFHNGWTVGMQVEYTGKEWTDYVQGQRVRIIPTPMKEAAQGYISFEAPGGFVFTVPSTDLK